MSIRYIAGNGCLVKMDELREINHVMNTAGYQVHADRMEYTLIGSCEKDWESEEMTRWKLYKGVPIPGKASERDEIYVVAGTGIPYGMSGILNLCELHKFSRHDVDMNCAFMEWGLFQYPPRRFFDILGCNNICGQSANIRFSPYRGIIGLHHNIPIQV